MRNAERESLEPSIPFDAGYRISRPRERGAERGIGGHRQHIVPTISEHFVQVVVRQVYDEAR